MKRNFKILFISLIAVLATTGCVKIDMSMSINKDKSMDLVIIEAFNNTLIKQYSEGESAFKEEDIKELKNQGYKVEEYSKDSMKGYKFSRSIKNIDEISTVNEVKGNLSVSTSMNNNEENKYLFSVKKGFFKNKYKATLESSDINDVANQTSQVNNEETTETTNSLGDFDYSTLMSSMDMKFILNVPYKALSSNATTTENGGKTLSWNLLNFKEDSMNFEFELYNMSNIYIALGIGIVGLFGIIALIILIIKKNSSKKTINNGYNSETTSVFPEVIPVEPTPIVESFPEVTPVEIAPIVESFPEVTPVEIAPIVESFPEVAPVEPTPIVESFPEVTPVEPTPIIESFTEVSPVEPTVNTTEEVSTDIFKSPFDIN